MTFHRKVSERVSLGTYTAATYLITPFLALHLKKRLKYDKEHPKRWREKQGFTNVPRPNGKVIWLNAVGLGEVMALRGLIHKFHDLDPDLNFLVTSSTRTSSETFTKDLPPKTIHQFLPLDTQIYSKRFLNHWRPNLALWSEQDIWPGLVHRVARRGIPQALINARMNSRSLQNKTIVRPLFSTTYKTFSFISAQEKETAAAIVALGALQDIHIDGSLKPHCPPLFVNPDTQTAFKSKVIGKKVWLAASCHSEDEDIALAAHRILLMKEPNSILILAPRNPARKNNIISKLGGLSFKVRSHGELPDKKSQIYLADTFSEMGLWYANSSYALIGGTFGLVEGHNPWEALQLGCQVMHGPHYKNFAADFRALNNAGASSPVHSPQNIVDALTSSPTRKLKNYTRMRHEQNNNLTKLVTNLNNLMRDRP